MLKTTTETIAKPTSALIIIGILKGYIKRPIPFFIGTILSFKKFKKTITLDLPDEFIKSSGLIA